MDGFLLDFTQLIVVEISFFFYTLYLFQEGFVLEQLLGEFILKWLDEILKLQFARLIDLFRFVWNVQWLIVPLRCEDLLAEHDCIIRLVDGLGKDAESLVWTDIGV